MLARTRICGLPCTRCYHKLKIPAFPFCRVVLKADKSTDPCYPKEVKTWGDRIRTRRLDLGVRQKDVATHLGVALVSVVAWENNNLNPSEEKLLRIKEFLGIPE